MSGTRPRLTAFLALAALVVGLVAVWSPQVANAAPWGAIVLDCHVDGTALAHDSYGIVRVADVTYDAGSGTVTSYETSEAFAGFGYDWADMKASEVDEAAKTLANHAAEKDLYEEVRQTDNAGTVGFWSLEPGLYLVDRVEVAPANEGYACDPLLLTVPLADAGQLTWTVTSQPKFEGPSEPGTSEPPATPPSETEPPAEPEGPMASTGDAALEGMGALLVVGGAGVAFSWLARSWQDEGDAQ